MRRVIIEIGNKGAGNVVGKNTLVGISGSSSVSLKIGSGKSRRVRGSVKKEFPKLGVPYFRGAMVRIVVS